MQANNTKQTNYLINAEPDPEPERCLITNYLDIKEHPKYKLIKFELIGRKRREGKICGITDGYGEIGIFMKAHLKRFKTPHKVMQELILTELHELIHSKGEFYDEDITETLTCETLAMKFNHKVYKEADISNIIIEID
jgi:hypothetical protein